MESTQSLVHLVAKLETLVNRFENALGGPAVPLGSGPVANAPAPAKPVTTTAAPVKKENPIFAEFDKEVASKIKPLEDAANVLGGVIPTIVISNVNIIQSLDRQVCERCPVPERRNSDYASLQEVRGQTFDVAPLADGRCGRERTQE